MSLDPGTKLGRYEIRSKIAEGMIVTKMNPLIVVKGINK